MVKKIVDILDRRGLTVTFAESCTGGKLASRFSEISGVSRVFNGSVVSYSNSTKSKWLGVNSSTLNRYGAVSRECVVEMLDGALMLSDADYAVAISGIAGPTGGTEDKPVGTVFIGVKGINSFTVEKSLFSGCRVEIQDKSVDSAISLLLKIVEEDIYRR